MAAKEFYEPVDHLMTVDAEYLKCLYSKLPALFVNLVFTYIFIWLQKLREYCIIIKNVTIKKEFKNNSIKICLKKNTIKVFSLLVMPIHNTLTLVLFCINCHRHALVIFKCDHLHTGDLFRI